jgi:hypothetical protein
MGIPAAILSFAPCIISVFEYLYYKIVIKKPAIFGLFCMVLSTSIISLCKNEADIAEEEL